MQDILSVALRALSFIFLLQAAGVTLFVAIFGRHLSSSQHLIRRLGGLSALLGIACVAGHFVLEAARMAGEMAGAMDASLQKTVLHSPNGVALALRVLGLSIVAVGLRGKGDLALTASVVGATIATFAFTVTGHTAIHPERWILNVLLVVHLLIVAFWFGALLPLYVVSVLETSAGTAKIVDLFSSVASWLVPGILLAGLALTAFLVPSLSVFGQPYGELLIAKFVGFVLLMGLAALNKWRLGPAIARGESPALPAFRRSVATEYVLIFGVLTATAIMTTFFSPE